MKNKLLIIIKVVLVFVLLILVFPYIKAEYLTSRYGKEFIGLEQQTQMLDLEKYHKVVSYSKNEATVFYVTNNSGNIIVFKRNETEEWIIAYWNVVWSKTGSADNFSWPYYF